MCGVSASTSSSGLQSEALGLLRDAGEMPPLACLLHLSIIPRRQGVSPFQLCPSPTLRLQPHETSNLTPRVQSQPCHAQVAQACPRRHDVPPRGGILPLTGRELSACASGVNAIRNPHTHPCHPEVRNGISPLFLYL